MKRPAFLKVPEFLKRWRARAGRTRKSGRSRKRKALLGFALLCAAAVAIWIAIEAGIAERWARGALVNGIENSTGAHVEMKGFHLSILHVRVEMEGLTLHGNEPPSSPPLFHADRVEARAHVVSFLHRKVALDELLIEKGSVAIETGKDGKSNLPSPPAGARRLPWQQQLFALHIRKFEWRGGNLVFHDASAPASVEGQNLDFSLTRGTTAQGEPAYAGTFEVHPVEIAVRKLLPFRSEMNAKFTLTAAAFSLDELRWKLPHSELDVRAEWADFSRPAWTYHSRGRLDLKDVREILRKPRTPGGEIEFTGAGEWRGGKWSSRGHYGAHRIEMNDRWFHAGGIETWGDYEADPERVRVPELHATAMGGTLEGNLEMQVRGLRFRVESQFHNASLGAALAAVDNRSLPVKTLHWDARMDVDSVCTWTADFKHFEVQGTSRWSPRENPAAGEIPATAALRFDFATDRRRADIQTSEISTPSSRVEMDGFLGAQDSALEVKFHADSLLDWNDLINAIRGPDAQHEPIAGRADWRGRVLGPLGGPTFSGQTHVSGARYDWLTWDEIDGRLEYSPDALQLSSMRIRRDGASARLDLWLQFDGAWNFVPESPWRMTAQVEGADTDSLQDIFDTHYPARGTLSGALRGSGTHAAPVLEGEFTVGGGQAWGYRVDRFSGAVHLAHDEVRFTGLELRRDAGRARGNVLIRPEEKETEFSISGESFSLADMPWIQTAKLPVAGEIGFAAEGRGPLARPAGHGRFTLRDLRVGPETQGEFTGHFDSDGGRLLLTMDSAMARGKLDGQITVGLGQDYPLSGQITVSQFDLDPLIVAGLHLRNLTGHSSVDARFDLGGALRQSETVEAEAHVSRASLDYEFVKLENDGPIELTYRRNEVRVERARLHGTNTDFSISGFARFDRDRPLSFAINGSADVRLAAGFLPDVEAHGPAQIEMTMEGTMSEPRITGHARLSDASASYTDFPLGLSHITGDIVFDRSRLSFDNVGAEAGGGNVKLSGSLAYGEGPLHYLVRAETQHLRVRYPQGASWTGGGMLELSGTPQGGVLSGNASVEHLLLGEDMDLSSVFGSQPETGGMAASSYAQNLQVDVSAETAPGARMDWPGAHVEMDGRLRVRGTLARPILLGSIRLLGGEISFRGNRYDLSRGEIVFSNPLRMDPVVNLEATTTAGQNDITISFAGPASHLTLSYRSDPPLPDSDILALLAMGSTGESNALRSSTSSASQSYGATALLSEAISSQLGGRIEKLFGVTRFRVDPFLAETSSDQNPAARVTIEQQVAHDLTITYSSNAASNQQQLIQFEYRVQRSVTVVGLRDINGTYSLSFEFKKHFK